MALALLCSPHSGWLLLCTQSGSGCAQWVRRLLFSITSTVCIMFLDIKKQMFLMFYFCLSVHSESLPKRERRPDRVASSRSCESASSWMKISMATWSGSLMLKSWMPTERARVSK